jgi:hypothetical protein
VTLIRLIAFVVDLLAIATVFFVVLEEMASDE